MIVRMVVAWGLVSSASVLGADPAAREDAKLERQKVLRAADTLDELTAQVETLRAEVTALKASNAALRGEVDELKSAQAAQTAARAKEREALLDEVTRLMAGGARGAAPSGGAAARPKPAAAAAEPAAPAAAKPRTQKGYEHTVAPGETIYSIARFYREQGVAVTSTNICEANGMDRRTPLQAGQKLFIPKATP
jgi:TolA-binding protein